MNGVPFTAFLYVISFLCATSQRDRDPLSGFERFEIIHPKVIDPVSRHKRDLNSSWEELRKSDKISVEFHAFERRFHLKMAKNKKLFSPHYQEMYQEGNGRYTTKTNVIKPENNCHYRGRLKNHENSWAFINICQGLSGMVFDGTESFHLHYYENNSETVNLISKASDMKPLNVSCGNEDSQYPWDFDGDHISHRFRRSSEWQFSHLGKNRRILELCIVADHSMFVKYRRQEEAVSRRVREIVNIVHGIYIQLNIVVVLVDLRIWKGRDETEVYSDASRTLNEFSAHANAIMRDYHYDDVQLISGVRFNKPTVGLAFVGTVCKPERATGVNEDHSTSVASVAMTLAHEIGHNFNMSHDQTYCICPNNNCIMGAHSSNSLDVLWSSCSIEAITTYLKDGTDFCLKNLPKRTELPVCGDGVVQNKEQCDCGLPQFCNNPCCNATTCQLYENATCASGRCCNLETCKVKEVATECREKQSECDLSEYCDGKSPACPNDILVQDGTECGNRKAFCFQGGCQSHDDQCRLLWGPKVGSADGCCYNFNTEGKNAENCGAGALKETFRTCPIQDVLCGSLKCDLTLNERLNHGGRAGREGFWRYRTCRGGDKATSNCLSYSINHGPLMANPGLVPGGAKCGENMMCSKQKCVKVETVRTPKCSEDCSGNGVCNSNGNCHCLIGFGSSACDHPGPGGSVDSGPSSDPDAGQNYVTAMYVIFFGVCPLLLTTASAIYFFCFLAPKIADMERCKQEQSTRRRTASFRAPLKRLPKLSLRSMSEDISYDSFSSSDEEETSMSITAKPLPAVPKNPPRIHVLRRNKAPGGLAQGLTSIKPATKDSSGIPSKVAFKPQHPILVNRKASQQSIHEGIILKVPKDTTTSEKLIAEEQSKRWNDESQHQQGVAKLAKLFEKK